MPLTGAEVAAHNNKDSCWVIVHGKAYDVTEFLPGMPPTHPVLPDAPLGVSLTVAQNTPAA